MDKLIKILTFLFLVLISFSSCDSDDKEIDYDTLFNPKETLLEYDVQTMSFIQNIGFDEFNGKVPLDLFFKEESAKILDDSKHWFASLQEIGEVYYLFNLGLGAQYFKECKETDDYSIEGFGCYIYAPPMEGEYKFYIRLRCLEDNIVYCSKVNMLSVKRDENNNSIKIKVIPLDEWPQL